MCSICSVLNLRGQPLDAAVGQRMIDLPWHRGPDDNGSLVLRASISPAQDEAFSSSD
jgi:asparagine synthetase B (glutamine-hydrolysing)